MKKLFGTIIVTTLLLTGCTTQQTSPADQNQATPPLTPAPTKKGTISYECAPGKTAFELLQSTHQVDFSQTSYGKMVTSIDGIPNGDGKYWLYLVDDKEATVGAEAYHCVNAEQINWELK